MKQTKEKDRKEMKQRTIRDLFLFITAVLSFFALDTDSVLMFIFAALAAVIAIAIDINR